MKTLILVSAVLLGLSSCTKDVVVPDSYYYSGYSSDPYYNPYTDPTSPYYDPNYDPYTDPNYDPYSGGSIKPGIHTVAPGKAAIFNSGAQSGTSGGN